MFFVLLKLLKRTPYSLGDYSKMRIEQLKEKVDKVEKALAHPDAKKPLNAVLVRVLEESLLKDQSELISRLWRLHIEA